MGRFNLLDEPWISVIVDQKGASKEVSLKELFEHAHEYRGLGGDTKTQDFAVLRLLLAVLHTVFSRFDARGEAYGYVDLDERLKPLEEIDDEDEIKDYAEDLFKTWCDLWDIGVFPRIVNEYLEKWRERFFLLDEKYPFYQVVKEDIAPEKLSKSKASSVSGKNINRLISESDNKIAMFSPKSSRSNNKEILTEAEIVRWLITFQSYTGLSDKVILGQEKYTASKGWLFDIGGIAITGDNLYQTLLLNLVLRHPVEKYLGCQQRPCWECTSAESVRRYFSYFQIDNLAELYTNWSRAIYIEPEINTAEPFAFDIVKLPGISHQNQFLEPMTLWLYNKSGENKDLFTPQKHKSNQALWRSFGLLTISYEGEVTKNGQLPARKPIIMDWLCEINESIGDKQVTLNAVSMKDDGNATSWVPIDEIIDSINVRDVVVGDIAEKGWVPRINDVVEQTKRIISFTYKNFLSEIKEIRNMSSSQWVSQGVEELYFIIDQPFRSWLSGINMNDSKDNKVFEWRASLEELVILQAERVVKQAGSRDYRGIIVDEKVKNIATAYNRFRYFLGKELIVNREV